MRISQTTFRGEAPRIAPQELPPNAAQDATNARLQSGDLEAWKQFDTEHALALAVPVDTIYQLNGKWLSWQGDVNAARGPVPGDTTFRLFLTGPGVYDRPQFTNYVMATTGAEPYPVATRPLGVPGPDSAPTLVLGLDPTLTTFNVDILDEGDVFETAWTASPNTGIAFHQGEASQVATVGKPAPSYLIRYDENDPAPQVWMARNFGVANASIMFISSDLRFEFAGHSFHGPIRSAQFTVQATQDGLGARIMVLDDGVTCTLAIGMSTAWAEKSAPIASATTPTLVNSEWYTLTMQSLANADGTRTVTATLYLGSAQLLAVTTTNVFDVGDWCGMSNTTTADEHGDGGFGEGFYTFYDNIHVQASGSTNYTPIDIATNYVFTFVNDLGQESAPSLPSNTVARPEGVSVTVTTSTNTPTGIDGIFGITTKRIYRAATGNTGTIYRFAAEIPLSTASYIDTLRDAELGEPLLSELWDMPPDDLQGIVALPNGIMAGFSKNQLCLSAQNYPHAWPVSYRLTTDTDIVGIGAIDTTVVIFTESFPYVAFGDDPAAYSMAKFEVPHAGVAKRSIAYLEGIGVVGATANGLMAVYGVGLDRNLTAPIFTREQWQALNPETIVATAHDNIYFFAYDKGGSDGKGAYALDMKPDGFGLVPLSFHFTAAYAEPTTEQLFLVLDAMDEPADVYLPLASTAPVPTGHTIYEFDAVGGSGNLVYRYRSKLNLLDYPTIFAALRLRAKAYANLVLRVYADGELMFEGRIADGSAFTLPTNGDNAYEEFEYELIGTSRVRRIDAAEDVREMAVPETLFGVR